MLNPDSVFQKLEQQIQPVEQTERLALADAVNRVAADDVLAPMNLPPFPASAMDGYAVRSADAKASAYALTVVGESLAGHPTDVTVGGGQAVRIFTGAMMPAGSDAVLLQEDAERSGDSVVVLEPPAANQWVRPIGHDVAAGATLVTKGTMYNSFHLSWLCACGIDSVSVIRKVKVGLFSTGDELVEVGQPLAAGQIYDSNRFAIMRLLERHPVAFTDLGNLPDDPAVIRATLGEAASTCDVIITSGGVSVGDADYVRDVVSELGEIDFWKIALKPGKPLAVGHIGNADFFGLPGNPVSTIVTLLLFVVPAIELRAGAAPRQPTPVPAQLLTDIAHDPGRREYQRGFYQLNEERLLTVRPTGDQSSNRLSTFQNANCLIVVPETDGSLAAGCQVEIILLPTENASLP